MAGADLPFPQGKSRKTLPSFDPSPCVSSTWPVTRQVISEVSLPALALPAFCLDWEHLLSRSSVNCFESLESRGQGLPK